MFCLLLKGSCDGCVWGRCSQMCIQPGGLEGGGGGGPNWERFSTQEMLQNPLIMPPYVRTSLVHAAGRGNEQGSAQR